MTLAAVYNAPLAHGGDLLEAGVMVSAMAMPVIGIVLAVVFGGRALAKKEADEAAAAEAEPIPDAANASRAID